MNVSVSVYYFHINFDILKLSAAFTKNVFDLLLFYGVGYVHGLFRNIKWASGFSSIPNKKALDV